MTRESLLKAFQSRAARIAVGASTVRGRGNAGTVAAARAFLRQLDLSPFGSGGASFARALNRTTGALKAALPRRARHWGIARKVLNVFLRDCLYTTYLEPKFHLSEAEELFELPLDSITVLQLKRAAGRGSLPPWPGVKNLTPALNSKYQQAASEEAARRGIPRVHLDAIWWSVSRDDAT